MLGEESDDLHQDVAWKADDRLGEFKFEGHGEWFPPSDYRIVQNQEKLIVYFLDS